MTKRDFGDPVGRKLTRMRILFNRLCTDIPTGEGCPELDSQEQEWLIRKLMEKKPVHEQPPKPFEKMYKQWKKEIADPYIRPAIQMMNRDTFILALKTTMTWAQLYYTAIPEEAGDFLNSAMDKFIGEMEIENFYKNIPR